MKTPWLASSCLLLASCAEIPTSQPVATNWQEATDNARFQRVKYNFYRDKTGQLFEQKHYVEGEGAVFGTRYDSTAVLIKDSDRVEVPLAAIVDLATYQELGSSLFSKDKNRVYYFYCTSGGGFRVIVNGANPATFRASPDYQYGFDDKHGFYCENQLRGLHVKQRQLLYGDTVAHFAEYVKDDQHVFYQATPVPGADAPTFHLVRGQKWEAADKNHRYQCCGQQLD